MSKNQIRSIKGTQDILPNETFKWQRLEQLVRSTMDTYNYKEIRTPVFEKNRIV